MCSLWLNFVKQIFKNFRPISFLFPFSKQRGWNSSSLLEKINACSYTGIRRGRKQSVIACPHETATKPVLMIWKTRWARSVWVRDCNKFASDSDTRTYATRARVRESARQTCERIKTAARRTKWVTSTTIAVLIRHERLLHQLQQEPFLPKCQMSFFIWNVKWKRLDLIFKTLTTFYLGYDWTKCERVGMVQFQIVLA